MDRIRACALLVLRAQASARGRLPQAPAAACRRAVFRRGRGLIRHRRTSTGPFGLPCSTAQSVGRPRRPESGCFSSSQPATCTNTCVCSAGLPLAPRPTRSKLRFGCLFRDRSCNRFLPHHRDPVLREQPVDEAPPTSAGLSTLPSGSVAIPRVSTAIRCCASRIWLRTVESGAASACGPGR